LTATDNGMMFIRIFVILTLIFHRVTISVSSQKRNVSAENRRGRNRR
jgi:hypothetical protein